MTIQDARNSRIKAVELFIQLSIENKNVLGNYISSVEAAKNIVEGANILAEYMDSDS